MVENSCSCCGDSENIGIPRPPNLWGRDINLLLMSEQFIPPVIAGMNSVLKTSSNCLSWFLMFGCPHEIYRFMFESFDETRSRRLRFIPRYFTQHTQLFYPLIYFFLNIFLPECFRPNNCTKMSLTLIVIFILVSLKTDWGFCTTFFFTINHDSLLSEK